MNQQNPRMAATAASSFHFALKLIFIFLVLIPAAPTAALEKEEKKEKGKQIGDEFLWHPSKLLLKDHFFSSNNNNNDNNNNQSSVNNEDILKKLMRTDGVHADAIEAKINSLLIPMELQQEKIVKGIYEEKKSAEKAIAIIQKGGGVNKGVILNKLKSRKDAADKRLQEIMNKSKEALIKVNAFSEFIQKQKKINELETNKNEDKSEKIDVIVDILQKKKVMLEKYHKELEVGIGN